MATSSKHILVVGLGNYTHPGTRHNVGMMVVDSIAERFNATWVRKNAWQAEIATITTSIRIKLPKHLRPKRTPPIAPVSSSSTSTTAPATSTTSTPSSTATTTATTTTNGDTSAQDSTKATPGVRIKQQPEIITKELTITLLKPLQLMNVSGTSVSRAARDLGIKAPDILVIHDDMERDIGKISFKHEGSANGHNGIKSCVKALGTQHFTRLRIGIGRPPTSDRSPITVANYVLGRFKPLEVEKLKELVYQKAGDEILRVSTVALTPPIK
ncbi:peptidyl-tRNA hydrolase protein 1 [Podila epigama]|nr:peptidyl-tRNA hydrolase protein 1 [Podila epigama]